MNRRDRNTPSGRQPGGFPGPFGGSVFGGPYLFDDFFSRDPFDDPFFTRPFGGMFGSSGGGMSGSGGLLGQGGLFGPRFSPFVAQDRPFLEQRPFNSQPEGRKGPVIEELDEDHPDTSGARPSSHKDPIVEHPDDEVRPAEQSHLNRNMIRRNQADNEPGTNFRSYSFQSSSVNYGGQGGTYHMTSSKRCAGGNGVVAEEYEEKDSSGKEIHRISRGIRDKGRSITRRRNTDGREDKVDTLHNLTEEETNDFEDDWETAATRSLPDWDRSRTLNYGAGNTSRPALEGGSRQGWHRARNA